MDILTQFTASLPQPSPTIIKDVRAYIEWRKSRNGLSFTPDVSDDVAIRTFLLDCRLNGADTNGLAAVLASLEKFYAWLLAAGHLSENPFEKYHLQMPILTLDVIHNHRRDTRSASPAEKEISHLKALNQLAELTNRSSDVQSVLDGTLKTLVEVMNLKSAWISMRAKSGFLNHEPNPSPPHGFVLAAAHNLPSSLEQSNRLYLTRPPVCRCQELLQSGRLKHAANIVECSRLKEAAHAESKKGNLLFHASVPILVRDQPVGIMNFATEDWQLFSASDLQLLTAGARLVASALERARLHDLTETQRLRLEQELKMARLVQMNLLPKKLPDIPGFKLAASWQPALETSGDYYNVFKLPDNRWGFLMADVCGKGAPAALYMAMLHGLIRQRVEEVLSPALLMEQVNQVLYEQVNDSSFITAFYAVLDPTTSSLKYAIAGHHPPLLRDASSKVKKLEGSGVALGILPSAEYKEQEITLEPSQSLVAYTDGVSEARNPSGEFYEVERLMETLQSAPTAVDSMLDHLRDDLSNWIQSEVTDDDITLFMLRRD